MFSEITATLFITANSLTQTPPEGYASFPFSPKRTRVLKIFLVSGEIYSKQKNAASVQVCREILKGLKQEHLAELNDNNTRLILGKKKGRRD